MWPFKKRVKPPELIRREVFVPCPKRAEQEFCQRWDAVHPKTTLRAWEFWQFVGRVFIRPEGIPDGITVMRSVEFKSNLEFGLIYSWEEPAVPAAPPPSEPTISPHETGT